MNRALVAAVALVADVAVVAHLPDRRADRWVAHDAATQTALADVLSAWELDHPGPVWYHTGNLNFDGEASVAIDQMVCLGLGQLVLAHPELRERYLPALRRAGDHLADPDQLGFATQVYGHNGLLGVGAHEGHAYLGYVLMGLAMLQRVDPDNPHGLLLDARVDDLEDHLFASPTGLIETYPGRTWPPDVTAVAGAIALRATARHLDRQEALQAWAERFERCAVDPDSGWLRQYTPTCGEGRARGSGTAVGVYFLSFATPELATRLWTRFAATGRGSFAGFGALREYPPGSTGAGDGDSGPVILGMSVGATGFGLGAAQAEHDADTFRSLYRTTELFGAPMVQPGGWDFAGGGVLGNALLLAMLTA